MAKLTSEQVKAKAITMLKSGKTSKEIAKHFRIPVMRVAAWKAWITMASTKKVATKKVAVKKVSIKSAVAGKQDAVKTKAINLLNQGKSSKHIAEKFNIPVQRVAAWKAWITMRNA